MSLSAIIFMVCISIFAGAYGTIIGAGGGFIFVPFLLILFKVSPEIAAGSGLVIVVVNSLIGTLGYFKQHNIAFKEGTIMGISAIPGTFIGSYLLKNYHSDFFI